MGLLGEKLDAATARHLQLRYRRSAPNEVGDPRVLSSTRPPARSDETEALERVQPTAPRAYMPEIFGKYQLLRKVAEGGMAEVFVATQRGEVGGFVKQVAIKRIYPHSASNDEALAMFFDEARIAAGLNHPNIVQIFDLGVEDGYFFICMEYVHGADLRSICQRGLKQEDFLPLEIGARIVADAAAGLHYAHTRTDVYGRSMNIIHRDVSPQNLLVGLNGAVKLCDFGIAKAEARLSHTRAGQIKGKLSYMSPEQFGAEGTGVDQRSDIFALGTVLYEATVGRRLFRGNTGFESMKLVCEGPIPPPSEGRPDYPPALERIVLTALQRNPEARYQTAEALQVELEDWLFERRAGRGASRLGHYVSELFPELENSQNSPYRDLPTLEEASQETRPVSVDRSVAESMDAMPRFDAFNSFTSEASDGFESDPTIVTDPDLYPLHDLSDTSSPDLTIVVAAPGPDTLSPHDRHALLDPSQPAAAATPTARPPGPEARPSVEPGWGGTDGPSPWLTQPPPSSGQRPSPRHPASGARTGAAPAPQSSGVRQDESPRTPHPIEGAQSQSLQPQPDRIVDPSRVGGFPSAGDSLEIELAALRGHSTRRRLLAVAGAVVAALAVVSFVLLFHHNARLETSQEEEQAAVETRQPLLVEEERPNLEKIDVRLESQPSGAAVVVNGQLAAGTTPGIFPLIRNEENEIVLFADGYLPLRAGLRGEERVDPVQFGLDPFDPAADPARVAITSDPVGAVVFVDGAQVGVTPLTLEGLPADMEHHVLIRTPGHYSHAGFYRFHPELENTIDVRLPSRDSAGAEAYVDLDYRALPRETVVEVNGSTRGMTPLSMKAERGDCAPRADAQGALPRHHEGRGAGGRAGQLHAGAPADQDAPARGYDQHRSRARGCDLPGQQRPRHRDRCAEASRGRLPGDL